MIRIFILWLLSFLPHRTIWRGEEKYLTRYYLLGGPRTVGSTEHKWLPFNLFLHCFHASDEKPAHNHPWTWARSLILKGSYRETRLFDFTSTSMWLAQTYSPGDVNRIDADTYHYVELLDGPVWTLFLVGRVTQRWGFLTEDGHVDAVTFIHSRQGPNVSVDDG